MKKSIILGIFFILVIAILSSVQLWNKKLNFWPDGKIEMQKISCVESGGEFKEETCVCPSVFPILDSETGRCRDIAGNSPISSNEAGVFKERNEISGSCEQKGGEMYVVPATPLSFCYFHQWGEPVVQELNSKSSNSKLNRVVFVSKENKERSAPKLWYAKEIKSGEISELGKLCLDCQDAFDKYGAKTVEVAGKQVTMFPAYEKKWDVYYLADALKGYDIVFILPIADLFRGAFLEDFWFDPLL